MSKRQGKEKLLLIDGTSLAYRAYFALQSQNLTAPDGFPTGAVYGFVFMLVNLLEKQAPDLAAVAFDLRGPTFRHEKYGEYKAGRAGIPDALVAQLEIIKEIVPAFGLHVLELPRFEADDIIGTLARRAEEAGMRVVIVTGDRDALQLVSDHCQVLVTRRGISEMVMYDRESLQAELGLRPEQVVDLKALMGDASDNIPGVKGIGEKTALELLRTYGTVDGVYEHLAELAPRVAKLLATQKDQAEQSRELARIDTAVPLAVEVAALGVGEWDRAKLARLFERLGFRTLRTRLGLDGDAAAGAAPPEAVAVVKGGDDRTVAAAVADLGRSGRGGAIIATAPGPAMAARVEAMVLAPAAAPAVYYIPLAAEPAGSQPGLFDTAGSERWPAGLQSLLSDHHVVLTGAHVKRNYVFMQRAGFDPHPWDFDVALAAYLLNPERGKYEPDRLITEYLQTTPPPGPPDQVLAWQARSLLPLRQVLEAELAARDMTKLFYEVEMPLSFVLADMEHTGIALDRGQLRTLGDVFSSRLGELEQEIYDLAGQRFNINSPRQLGEVLFEKLGLPVGKKTPKGGGYSTDAEVLEALAPEHEIVKKILEYRTLAKLKGTYVDGLYDLVNPGTGRLHTTFHQTVTATGRLSSSDPNLQNIPARAEPGRQIRRAFVPGRPGWFFVAADYSQIELRLLAGLSKDQALMDAFQHNEDIHRRTASEVFGVPLDQVTDEQRARAKAVNFGIMYGLSDYGLAQQVGVSREEAKKYIEGYFARYPTVRRFIDETVEQARKQGYVTTLLNRRRLLPDLYNNNRNLRLAAERAAINTPIQGSAADIIKVAMVSLHRHLRDRRLAARLVLQVHDELILEVPPEEVDVVKDLLRDDMEHAVDFPVPLKVDVAVGTSWYEV